MLHSKNIDMTEGPIIPAVISYAIPIILAGMLQILFNAADLAVVGNFAGENATPATAAVGATGSIISLIVNTVMGLSVGVNVLLSRSIGAQNRETSHRIVHTAIAVSAIAGVLLAVIGILVARPAMVATDCPDASLEMAVQYMVIYFLGCPGIMVYNFGSAILRTKGDTRRPLYFLMVSGIANVLMNLLFVAVFFLDAAGVAIATTLSQYLAAFLTVRCLMKQEDETRLELRQIRIYSKELLGIVRYGLPSGITNAMYSISNVQIQSAINSYGESAVAGNSACASLEGFISAGISALNAATVAFMGQNIGAGKKTRVRNAFLACLVCAVAFSAVLSVAMFLLGRPLLRIYLPSDPKGVEVGMIRAQYVLIAYAISGVLNVIGGAVQAFGYSTATMINSVVGVLGVRIFWMRLIYPVRTTLDTIYICYPVTWILIVLANSTVLAIAYTKYRKKGKVL